MDRIMNSRPILCERMVGFVSGRLYVRRAADVETSGGDFHTYLFELFLLLENPHTLTYITPFSKKIYAPICVLLKKK